MVREDVQNMKSYLWAIYAGAIDDNFTENK